MIKIYLFICLALYGFNCAFAQKPNIVLIVVDDQGLDALGCYGNPIIQTPHTDALAKQGIRFTNAFCTVSSCSPSRSVILTGLQNHANGMYGLQHTFHHFQSFDNIKSLPVFLKEMGYRTARVGKYHLAPENVYAFDEVLSDGSANNMQALGRSPVEMAEKCEHIFSSNSKEPFFLYFCTDDPHRGLPFKTWPEPNAFGNKKESYPGVKIVSYDPKDVEVPSFLPDLPETRKELAQYYQSVSRLDQGIGKLSQLLKKYNKWENTLIIYISDNGMAFPGAKTTLYDPGMHLPCLIKTPYETQRGKVNDEMISWVDITPTILDYAGINPANKHFHGSSLKDIIEGKSQEHRDTVFASHTFHEVNMYYPMRVIRTKHYKLIWNLASCLPYPNALDLEESITWQRVKRSGRAVYGKRKVKDFLHRPEFELYDIQKDPDEIHNLAYDAKYENLRNSLSKRLIRFQEDTMDPWIKDHSEESRWSNYVFPK